MFKAFWKRHRRWLWVAIPLLVFLLLFCTNYVLQTVFAHRNPFFVPDYPQINLTAILEKPSLADADYREIFDQTGLAKPAVEALLLSGQDGKDQILATQRDFFTPREADCAILLPGRFTCEDRVSAEGGVPVASVPLAPAEPGDIILSFSTHTFGWRHGHAGLVVDAAGGTTLEAVVLGSDSGQMRLQHWQSYSNFMLLRVKDATPEQRLQVSNFALGHLDRIPYSLLSGILGPKAPDPEGALVAQCSYLPWYAWQWAGYDLDSDGGRIVTVADLAGSPLVEVVQVYGIDPATLLK